MERRIVNFGKVCYAVVELRRAGMIRTAMKRIERPLTAEEWRKLERRATTARIEAQ
jgi:hypothetical protein